MSDGLVNSIKIVERARVTGEVVIFPESNQLLIDIDSELDHAMYIRLSSILSEWCTIEREEIKPSSSAGHYHITLTLNKELDPVTRIALQACLGSDKKRELLSFIRFQRGDERPTIFIAPPMKLLKA
jgi:hypothetical protein